jgi:hypothetical protein
MKRRNIVGQLINFRGLVYAPVEENGVIFLFAKLNMDLDLNIETIRKRFPDCVAKRYFGENKWEEVLIEFEYKSSHFIKHGHLKQYNNGVKCDIIVCWEHDWKECPPAIEVIELKEEYKKYINQEAIIENPPSNSKPSDVALVDLYGHYNTSRKLHEKFEKILVKTLPKVTRTIAKSGFFYYSPEKVFLSIKIQKQGLRLRLFTSGKHIKGVDVISQDGSYAQKWGQLYIKSSTDIASAIKSIKKSNDLIHAAISNNENTGWYAEVD